MITSPCTGSPFLSVGSGLKVRPPTATARRSVGATLLNRVSSRGHAVLTLEMKGNFQTVVQTIVPFFLSLSIPPSLRHARRS
ncbi:hypothetical protein K438DRAFT_1892364 [Mycena galopus ATCC 62051]|nr:hypothetical protein K438DRAFT_1892364 [Mycena galopus ATCC 62051]